MNKQEIIAMGDTITGETQRGGNTAARIGNVIKSIGQLLGISDNNSITNLMLKNRAVTGSKIALNTVDKSNMRTFSIELLEMPVLNQHVTISKNTFLRMIGGDISDLIQAVYLNSFFQIRYQDEYYLARLSGGDGVHDVTADIDGTYVTITFEYDEDEDEFVMAQVFARTQSTDTSILVSKVSLDGLTPEGTTTINGWRRRYLFNDSNLIFSADNFYTISNDAQTKKMALLYQRGEDEVDNLPVGHLLGQSDGVLYLYQVAFSSASSGSITIIQTFDLNNAEDPQDLTPFLEWESPSVVGNFYDEYIIQDATVFKENRRLYTLKRNVSSSIVEKITLTASYKIVNGVVQQVYLTGYHGSYVYYYIADIANESMTLMKHVDIRQ